MACGRTDGSSVKRNVPVDILHSDPGLKNSNPHQNLDASKGSVKTPAKSAVKSFLFENPSPEWTVSETPSGDGTFTKASYKLGGANVQCSVTSIGLPATGKDAAELVKECETGFAQGMAKRPEFNREWISKGFSISRYADPDSGDVVAWCISDSCKVRLKFSFGKGTVSPDNVKAADLAIDEFFVKNPTGGANLK